MNTELMAARESLRRKQEVIDEDERTIYALKAEIARLKAIIREAYEDIPGWGAKAGDVLRKHADTKGA